MMRVIAKWKVVIYNERGQDIGFHIDEDFYSNLLRDLAKFDFGDDIIGIQINKVTSSNAQTGVRTS